MIIKHAKLLGEDFRFQTADIRFDSVIREIASEIPAGEETVLDAEGKLLIPGLVDVHTHGAVGQDASEEGCDFAKWQRYLLQNGVTTFLPTTATITREELFRALENLKDAEGVNLEGPFLSLEKKGAHNADKIIEIDLELLERIKDRVKITTVAPEVGDNLRKIKAVLDMGIRVSLGHSAADYDTCKAAFDCGATQVTHTFNAMNPLHHRSPALIGAAVEDDRVFCEAISDGFHLHPSVIRLLYRALGPDRMLLISDAIAAMGLADGEYESVGQHVYVKDGKARLADGTIAGSTTHLMEMMRRAVSFGIPLEDAVKMASLTPARAVGMDADRGSISVGKRADLVLLEPDLKIAGVIYQGKPMQTNKS